MTIIRRLTDSCLTVATDRGTTLFDPGFHTFDSGKVDLASIGEVQQVLITHEHGDHVKPEFVRWLIDRGADLRVYSNQSVARMLAPHDIEVTTANPSQVTSEDVVHEMTPMGSAPPNRSYTLEGIFTHPGDSYQPSATAPVLALPLVRLWGSTTASVDFAQRLGPQQVVPVHDWYVDASGRQWVYDLVGNTLAGHGIEFVPLDWGESYSL